MTKKKPMMVREPVQVYLASDDRAMLDGLAERTGLSRAEILRRGIRSFAAEQSDGQSPMLQFLLSLKGEDWPADIAERHDDYLVESYLDNHEDA